MFAPVTWIIILLAAGFLFRKRIRFRNFCFITAAVLLVLFSSPALYNAYARWYQPAPAKLPHRVNYEVGIVAGGFGSVDYQGNGYFNSSADRFLQAVKLYKQGRIKHILISGGNSKKKDKTFNEAAWAREEMTAFGIPDSVIYVEDQSTGTRENAIHSKRILDSLGVNTPCLLITSAFHMPRARKLFANRGIQVVPWPCNYTEGRGPFVWTDLIPRLSLLSDWSKYIKESVWWVAFKV